MQEKDVSQELSQKPSANSQALSKELLKNIRRIQIQTNRQVNDLLAGAYHSAFKGMGIQFEDVREYHPGDEVRSIDWNVTARMNTPFIKRFKEERELSVTLLIDVSGSCLFGSHTRQKKDLITEIGALLAFSAIKNQDKIGLILFSDKVEKYIPPKKGVQHVLRVIRELLVKPFQRKKTDVREAMQFLGKVHSSGGIAFLISDFISPDYQKIFAITSKRFDLITLYIEDPLEKSFPNFSLVEMVDAETGERRLVDTSSTEIQKLFQEKAHKAFLNHKELCDRVGAGVIKIETNKPYIKEIRKFFRLRERVQR